MFSNERYEELIKSLVNSGLKPSINWSAPLSSSSLLLRHDVDFSVDFAHQLAVVEHRLNIQSTFFFMLTSNMYNLLSGYNQKMVKEIAGMGHKVSIHFDPTVYENLESFVYEKNVFENTIGREVDISSIHRPGPFLEKNNVSLSGIPQTYQNIYFKKMKYISDSGGRDVFPAISEYFKSPGDFGLHLLIHPIWWIEEFDNATDTLNNWRNQNMDFITSEMRKNCKNYEN